MKRPIDTLGHNVVQLFIAFDQLVGVVLALLCFGTAWADETMSARSWRAFRDGRRWGRVLMPVIDWMFSWQKPDPLITEPVTGQMILRHCERAFYKEVQRRCSPPDQRNDAQRTAP